MEKKIKKQCIILAIFQHFSLETMKKSCLKELKFCEIPEIPNPAFSENFSCLSHWEVRNIPTCVPCAILCPRPFCFN